jgi:DNA-binding protein H-NS
MTINLDALSHKELEDLITSAEAHIKASRAENIKTVRGKIDALLTSQGLTLADVFTTRGGKGAKTGAVAPKYQNPSNAMQTWSGRGKRPLWFVEAYSSPHRRRIRRSPKRRSRPRSQAKKPLRKKRPRRRPKNSRCVLG